MPDDNEGLEMFPPATKKTVRLPLITASLKTQIRLTTSRDFNVRLALTLNRHLTTKAQMVLAQDDDLNIRQSLALNPALSEAAQEILAVDSAREVRLRLAENPSLTFKAAILLYYDGNNETRVFLSNLNPRQYTRVFKASQNVLRNSKVDFVPCVQFWGGWQSLFLTSRIGLRHSVEAVRDLEPLGADFGEALRESGDPATTRLARSTAKAAWRTAVQHALSSSAMSSLTWAGVGRWRPARPNPGGSCSSAPRLPHPLALAGQYFYNQRMIGLGSTRVTSGTRPLSPLAGGYRDDGILLTGLGLADALALMAVIHPGPYYWAGVIVAVLLFTVGYVALVDHNQKWLTAAIADAIAIPDNAAVRDHQGLAQKALLMVALYGALNAAWVLWGRTLGVGLDLLPGMMIAQGATMLVRAERVRSWQRDHTSELLVSFGWKRQYQRSYFIRPLAHP